MIHSFTASGRFFLIVAALFCAGCASQKTSSTTPRQRALLLVQAAQGALQEGDRVAAFNYLKSAQELDDSCAEIFHMRGIAFMSKRDLAKALIEFKTAAKLAPESSSIANTYGKVLLDSGKWELAETELLKAADDPTFSEAYKALTSLGIMYEKRGDKRKAEEYYQKAIQENSALACIAYQRRAQVRAEDGRLQSAQKDLEKATGGQCVGNIEGQFALGDLYEKRQNLDKAREKYLEIQQQFPDSAQAEEAVKRLRKLTIE